MLGQVLLGKYKVMRLLAQGGMSCIYLAHDEPHDREVAVKVLQEPLRRNTKAVEHLRREIFILSRFSHPHAVAALDAAPRHPAGPVLVLEYLRGTDLGQLLRRDGAMNPRRAGRLLLQLCDALAAAHAAGIVHRDVKPGNVMVLHPGTGHEAVKLMDFGLARMASLFYIGSDELADYSPPTGAGTPEYLPPEQVLGQTADARGDIYSTGVMLFEMLAGRRPFVHEEMDRLLQAHVVDEPPTFTQVLEAAPTVPTAVEAVVRRCLAKAPEHRYATATELAEAYELALGRKLGSGLRPVVRHPGPGGMGKSGTPTRREDSSTRLPIVSDRSAVRHRLEACMPEAMAMLKIKGFLHDLGGEMVESEPGRVRMRLAGPAPKAGGGWLRWLGGGGETAVAQAGTDVELHMERPDPAQPNRLRITLLLRPDGGLATPEWRGRCDCIGRDLQAYLMGR
jgi:serine/threonine-protein kinase